jgi:hypothetical protein
MTASASVQRDHPDLTVALGALLDRAIEVQRADFGAIRLFDPATSMLRLVTQRNFDPELLAPTLDMRADDQSMHAFHNGRVVVEDLLADEKYVHLKPMIEKFGIRGIQFSPIVTRSGKRLGLLSTHFRRPHLPGEFALRETDRIIATAAEVIELWSDDHRAETPQGLSAKEELKQAFILTLKSSPPRPGSFALPSDVAFILERATREYAVQRGHATPEQMIVEVKQILRDIDNAIPQEFRRDLSSDVIRWAIAAYYKAKESK